MISYAQNFEDVMLWRALKNIKNGFYIDVGANDPIELSVTKWFYDQGWTGINIEPSKEYYDKLCADRPKDINVCKGAGEVESQVHFYEFPDTGLSTVDKEIAQNNIKLGFKVHEIDIEITTLRKLCETYALNKAIHFLKIDVEGGEGSVLRGMDFKKFRPWILVIEATLPLSQTLSIEWDEYVKEQGYVFAFFDGLSRYYVVAERQQDLMPYFKVPANVFDEYVRYIEIKLQKEKDILQKENSILQDKTVILRNEIIVLRNENTEIRNSLSWGLTKPLREIKNFFVHLQF